MAEWNPLVLACRPESASGQYRLTVATGHDVLAQIEERDEAALRLKYKFFHGQLPLIDYRSILAVEPEGASCAIAWTSEFTPLGPEGMILPMLQTSYDQGLDRLKALLER